MPYQRTTEELSTGEVRDWFIPATHFSVPPDEDRWLVDSLVGAQSVGVIGGAPKLGKSWFAAHIAVAVASGLPCVEQFTVHDQGPVLMVSAEGPPWMPTDRLQHICGHLDLALDDLAIKIMSHVVPRLDNAEDQARLLDEVGRHDAKLVLDPLVHLHAGDENSSAGLAPVLNFLNVLRRQTGASIVLVHHVRKGAKGRGGSRLRGSSALHGWLDSGLYLGARGSDAVLTSEQRCGQSLDPVGLRLVTHTQHHHLEVVDPGLEPPPADQGIELKAQIVKLLVEADLPIPRHKLRDLMCVKSERLTAPLLELESDGTIERGPKGITVVRT